MSKICTAKTASQYLVLWREVEAKIEDEINLTAVKQAENGVDTLEFISDRLKGLRDLAEYYKLKYEQAYACENNNNTRPARLKTYNNGL